MASEIQLTLTGYRADEVLPEESGYYPVLLEYTGGERELWTLHYSAKHRAWNIMDHMTEEQAEMLKSDRVTHWFRLPEAPALKGDAPHDKDCELVPARREGCCWCSASGVINKVYIRTDDSEYTFIDARFCPKCGRELEDAE